MHLIGPLQVIIGALAPGTATSGNSPSLPAETRDALRFALTTIARFTTLALISCALSACNQSARYRGDGTFTDRGFMRYADRYAIDLGPVDLSARGTHTFNLSGLPHAQFTVGIDVIENATTSVSGPPLGHVVRVRVELRTANRDDVILEESELHNWVRSFAMAEPYKAHLYRRGEIVEAPLHDNVTRIDRVGVKASGGWGTYFNSERRNAYVLKVTVVDTNLTTTLPARITLRGWDR